MKKALSLLMVLAIAFVMIGCASTQAPTVASADDWWNNPPADTADVHYEVGSGKGSSLQISRNKAKADANTALAQYINNSIDAIVTTYVNDAGEIGTQNYQAVEAFESLSKQRAQATLTGVTFKYQTMDDGTVYVLASLPIGPVAEELKANVKEAFVKNAAAAEANNMMNNAIDKYFGTTL